MAAPECYSRVQASADSLGVDAVDAHRFADKAVLLTGEVDKLRTLNGQQCFISSLRLLARFCGNLSVWLPRGAEFLRADAERTAAHIGFADPVRFPRAEPDPGSMDAILSVGVCGRDDVPWTVINSEGWAARVSSSGVAFRHGCDQANPAGALAAASLGAAEVFKRLLRVRSARGPLAEPTEFSLWSYTCDGDAGPPLPRVNNVDLLLGGAGAIGNAVVWLLQLLKASGRVWIIDAQRYEPPNLGTCLLVGSSDLKTPKAEHAASLLRPWYDARGYHGTIEAFGAEHLRSSRPPSVVIGAVDNIEARHQLQDLWPDLIIDGAIGTFLCQASRHPWGEDAACLKCMFRHPAGEPAERIASRATGLQEHRLHAADDLVRETDVAAAPPEKRAWLRDRLGWRICAVSSEGVAQELSDIQQKVGFRPSLPFVASMSASMVFAELLKHCAGLPTAIDGRFQFDILRGPQRGESFGHVRRRDCICVTRRVNIDRIRQPASGQGPR